MCGSARNGRQTYVTHSCSFINPTICHNNHRVLKMPLTIIRESPDVDAYTPLSTFQSETPASFSTPVLHHLQADCTVVVSSDQASLIPIFDVKADGGGGGGIEDVRVDGIDLWVTNELTFPPCRQFRSVELM